MSRLSQTAPCGPAIAKPLRGPPLVLHRLLYKPIVAVERDDLRLTFKIDDGSALAVLSELGPYESGHIETSELGLVVF